MRCAIAVFAVLLMPKFSTAQVAQFKWANGQVLHYRVAQATTASETVEGKTSETTTSLQLIKRWHVSAVDADGVATLTMAIERMRMETKTPAGETLLFDSADPAKSTPALREEMTKYIGVPLTIVRIDKLGRLAEVKESKFGPANRLECDLPFKIVLPATPLAAGATWERPFTIKLDGMNGAVDSFPAKQKLICKGLAQGLATVTISTELETQPAVAADLVGLIPLLPTGEVIFDVATGRLKSVKFQILKDVANTQTEGSKYKYASTYVEELAN